MHRTWGYSEGYSKRSTQSARPVDFSEAVEVLEAMYIVACIDQEIVRFLNWKYAHYINSNLENKKFHFQLLFEVEK